MATTREYQFHQDDQVYSSDGEKLGKLTAVGPNSLTVEKGWLFPTEYDIPLNAVENYNEADGAIYLAMTKDEALNSGWDAGLQQTDNVYGSQTGDATGTMDPTLETTEYASGSGIGLTDMGGTLDTTGTRTGAAWDATRGASYSSDATSTGDNVMGTAGTTGSADYADTRTGKQSRSDDDNIVVPVHEETLEATTRERQAGEVQINKRVVAENQTLNVPVEEEQVNITRRVVDRDANGEESFREETIAVPLKTEDVELNARTRVAEEVEVNKEKVRRTEQVSGKVRKEVVDVDTGTLNATRDDVTGSGANS
jgi:uncharacterized protein (TIGR02271 family)